MKFLREKLLFTMLMTTVMISFVARAETAPGTTTPPPPKNEPIYSEYYTIDENNFDQQYAQLKGWGFAAVPTQIGPDNFIQAAKLLVVNLLRWTLHNEQRPMPVEGYIRKLHFGRWINDPTDDTCMNTRAKVLVRDSEGQVTYRHNKTCVVDTGKWLDPYSDRDLQDSREVQIDHMVPLKHAYMSGAWQWDYKTRCLYANYLGYHDHLIPASAKENTSKGDRAPNKYLPPNEAYRCEYVKNWLTIKLIWHLNMTQDELQAIHEVVTNLNCKVSDFKISQQDLLAQRQYIQGNLEYCMQNKR